MKARVQINFVREQGRFPIYAEFLRVPCVGEFISMDNETLYYVREVVHVANCDAAMIRVAKDDR